MGQMDNKTVVITGGNAGIGKAAAIALANQGAHVVLACRNADRARAAREDIAKATSATVDLVTLDLARFDSIRFAAEDIQRRFHRVDVLLNNAGLIVRSRQTTPQGHEMIFGVNHLGPFLLTHYLREHLIASGPARVVTVASGAHNFARRGMQFDDLQTEQRKFRPMSAYAQSKLANILFTRALAKRLAGTNVTANCLHPGFVGSSFARDGDMGKLGEVAMMLGNPFSISPEKGARTSVYLASDPSVASVSGEYFYKCKPHRTTRWAASDTDAERLWNMSQELCNVS